MELSHSFVSRRTENIATVGPYHAYGASLHMVLQHLGLVGSHEVVQ